jgi:gluconate 2-dehydrogenase gamma chain
MAHEKFKESRRDFLNKTLAAAPVLAIGAAAGPAVPIVGTGVAEAAKAEYQPSFFNKDEYVFIKAAVSRLIPADRLGPGALEAGVPEFIDRQLASPYGVAATWYMQGPFKPDEDPMLGYQLPLKPTELYRLGIAEADAFCRKQYKGAFHELPTHQQDEALSMMESGKAQFDKVPSKAFFAALLQNTREGFFADPIHGGNKGLVGWKLIGFPGARADFMDWVGRNERYPFPPVSISGSRG